MPDSPLIHVQRGPQRFGPYPCPEVVALHAQRRLLAADLAWHEGLAAWEPLGVVMNRIGSPLPPESDATDGNKWLIPVGRSGWAIAAGYFGLFSVLGVFAPAALLCGIMGLRSIRKNPGLGGKGRAWFGIVMGAIFTALVAFGLVAASLQS